MTELPNIRAENDPERVVAIVAAAGSGTRIGGSEAKQFIVLGGRPMLRWSVDVLLAHASICLVVVVAPAEMIEKTRSLLPTDSRLVVVAGGDSRTASVRAGLRAADGVDAEYVLIHDAARPGLQGGDIDALIHALRSADAACPALPVTDALKRRARAGALTTVDREGLYRVQTPQAFRWPVIRRAYEGLQGDAVHVDDLALVEEGGARVELTAGREGLNKVTHVADLMAAERMLATPEVRMGMGFDVHAFEPGGCVTLCGVEIAHKARLKGHSDADVAWHALTDAILGAAALGDIGDHFPPSDPQWKGASSAIFLAHAMKLVRDRGWRLANVDVAVICERPKIAPHREAMRNRTAELLGLEADRVSIKATTTERLGFTGREEGIAAQAVATLSRGGGGS